MEHVSRTPDAAGMVTDRGVGTLLARWQAARDQATFTVLVEMIRTPVERVVTYTLRHHGIRDPGARDDAVALVLEQLQRLANGRTTPATFDPERTPPGTSVDSGWAYVRCVARSRARDMARETRRRDSRNAEYARRRAARRTTDDDDESCAGDVERLRTAIAALDESSRAVVTLLLEGKTQAAVAHMLGACEGTVSRMRARAIRRLRALLGE